MPVMRCEAYYRSDRLITITVRKRSSNHLLGWYLGLVYRDVSDA